MPTEIIKNLQESRNSNVLNLSFWMLSSSITIHYNTFLKLFNKKTLDLETLSGFIIVMLISVFVFKLYKYFTGLLFHPLDNFLLRISKKDDNLKKINPLFFLVKAIEQDNYSAYKYHEKWETNQKRISRERESFTFLLVVIIINLIAKGNLYSYLYNIFFDKTEFINIVIIVIMTILSIVSSHLSIYDEDSTDLGIYDYLSKRVKK